MDFFWIFWIFLDFWGGDFFWIFLDFLGIFLGIFWEIFGDYFLWIFFDFFGLVCNACSSLQCVQGVCGGYVVFGGVWGLNACSSSQCKL